MAWQETSASGAPSARECAAVSLSGDRILIFGGMWLGSDAEYVISDEAHLYDSSHRTWTKLATAGIRPKARTGHALVALPDSEVVLAAYGLNHDSGHLSDVCLLDLDELKWTHASLSGQLPSARDKVGACAGLRARAYIHGGFGVVTLDDEEKEEEEEEGDDQRRAVHMGWHDDLYAFDLESHRMERIQPSGACPAARAAHSLVALDVGAKGSLFLFGGRTQTGRTNDLWRLDLSTVAWSLVKPSAASAPPPSPRSFQSACAISSSALVVFGGLDAREAHADDLYVFNAASEQWARAEPSGAAVRPSARASCALGVASSNLFLFGGSSSWVAAEGAPSCYHGDSFVFALQELAQLGSAGGAEGEKDAPLESAERPDKRARSQPPEAKAAPLPPDEALATVH
jgi:hypothetical protein